MVAEPARADAAAPLFAYAALFVALYAGFGAQSPYLPALLMARGLDATVIGAALAVGTAVRIAVAPLAGGLADRLGAPRAVFAACAAAAALATFAYATAGPIGILMAVMLLQAVALAPLAPLADALVLRTAAAHRHGFDYGWVRGAGSAAFICGTVIAGQVIGQSGLGAMIWLAGGLLAFAAGWAPWLPLLASSVPRQTGPAAPRVAPAELLRIAAFRRVLVIAALILGSHAMHDGFAVIRWSAAGIGPGTAGLLWSEAVAAEVVVFLAVGRPLLDRIGPAAVAMLAALAGILRWVVSAETAWLPAIAAIQPLHGVTFALLHLACMRRLAESVPPHLGATAMTVYGVVGIGAATAVLTLLSGWLYGLICAGGFWVMAALCAVALPFARKL